MTATIAHLATGPALRTTMSMGLHVNPDTEIVAVKDVREDGSEYFDVVFRSPGAIVGGLHLYMSEEDMLRMWFVLESARRQSGTGA